MNKLNVARGPNLQPVDPIWTAIREEATEAVERDPLLAAFLYATILNQDSLRTPSSIAWPSGLRTRTSRRHHPPELQRDAEGRSGMELDRPRRHPGLLRPRSGRDRFLCRFSFQGFHAVQTHRLAHWLYKEGRKDFALYLQSAPRRSSR